MVTFINIAGKSLMVSIAERDIEDTEGYNPGEVTIHLYPKEHELIFTLKESDIPAEFHRHPVYLEIIWGEQRGTSTERFDAHGIARLRKLIQSRR